MSQIRCRCCFTVHEVVKVDAEKPFVCFLCGEMVQKAAQRDTSVGSGNTVVNGPVRRKAATPTTNKVRGKIHCPNCQSHLKVTAVKGKNVQCPLCTAWFRFVPESEATAIH